MCREVPEALRNFYDMWNEDGWDVPGNYDFGKALLYNIIVQCIECRANIGKYYSMNYCIYRLYSVLYHYIILLSVQ